MTGFFIFVGVVSLIPLVSLIWKSYTYLSSHIVYPDLAIGEVAKPEQPFRIGETEIKLAYVGNKSLVVQSLSLRLPLRYQTYAAAKLAWIQLPCGYLINDLEGLREMVGPQLKWFVEGWRPHLLNTMCGVLLVAFVLSLLGSPFGWILLLLSAPYDTRKLLSKDGQIRLVDTQSSAEIHRPFILKPETEMSLTMTYDYELRTSGQPEGFPRTARAEYVSEVPQRPWWKLPRRGQGIWRTEEVLFVQARGRWRRYSVALSEKHVRLMTNENDVPTGRSVR